MPSNHLVLCHPFLLLPSIFRSIRVFFSDSVLHIRWRKYWSFNFSISPSNEYSGLISLRMDWLGLLAVQGTLKSLLQRHSSAFISYWFLLSLRSRLHLSLFHWPHLLQYSLPLLVTPLLYLFLLHWTLLSHWLILIGHHLTVVPFLTGPFFPHWFSLPTGPSSKAVPPHWFFPEWPPAPLSIPPSFLALH